MLASSLRGQGVPALDADVDRILAVSREVKRLFDTEVLPLVRAGDHASLVARNEQIMDLTLRAQDQAEVIAKKAEVAMDDLGQHVRATQHGAIRLTIIAHVMALLTAIIVGLYLYRTIARPISRLASAASRVGAGDLESPIVIEREDELGRLSRRFNEMMQSVKDHQTKLLQTERLVGLASMSAGIAHELNNPIGVILGYAKLLRRRGDAVDPAVLAAIEEEAERCHQVIEGLLELTRGGVLNTAPVDLRLLADDVLARLRAKSAAATVAMQVHGHATAKGDESKLRLVLTNLVANAIEACGAEGRVVVLLEGQPNGTVSIEVHDTGTGISVGARNRIFEPFFTTKAAGTGLGLAISRAVARAHGGDVILLSTSDSGSRFRLTLPAATETA
jgi:signal transduction histidine kinase